MQIVLRQILIIFHKLCSANNNLLLCQLENGIDLARQMIKCYEDGKKEVTEENIGEKKFYFEFFFHTLFEKFIHVVHVQ